MGRSRGNPLAGFLLFAALALLMVPILPITRPHYYAFGALAFDGFYAAEWPRRKGLWPGWLVTAVAGLSAAINQHEAVDFRFATYAALALVAVTLGVAPRREPEERPVAGPDSHGIPVQAD